MGETTHGGDVLFGKVEVGRGIVLSAERLSLADAVDSLVLLGTMMVSVLTGTGNGPTNTGGMPSTDTTDTS